MGEENKHLTTLNWFLESPKIDQKKAFIIQLQLNYGMFQWRHVHIEQFYLSESKKQKGISQKTSPSMSTQTFRV